MTPVALYQGARSRGLLQQSPHQIELHDQQRAPTMPAWIRPVPREQERDDDRLRHRHHDAGQARRAFDAERTGSEPMPICVSPSIDLKSFSVMMPCAPTL